MKRFIEFAMRLLLGGIALLGVLNTFFSWVVDKNIGNVSVSTYETASYDGTTDYHINENISTELTPYNLWQLNIETAVVIAVIFLAIIYFLFKDGFKAWSNNNITMILGGFTIAAAAGIYSWFNITDWVEYMNVGQYSPVVGNACYSNLILSIFGFIGIVAVKFISDKFDDSGEEKKGLIDSIQEAAEKFQGLFNNE